MATRMLIDARHSEETRVAVLKGNRIEEFDFESAEHKQIKGNIYLAKVTRVEPSLQAAFVDFGGNRHGFLAFSEIHPDYYQIPHADRAALIAEEQEAADEEAALRDEEDGEGVDDPSDLDDEDDAGVEEIDTSEKDDVATIEDGHLDKDDGDDETGDDETGDDETGDDETGDEDSSGSDDDDSSGNGRANRGRGRGRGGPRGKRQQGRGGSNRAKEIDDVRAKRQALRRRYKIQDVIQRRQVLLVQVVKEERGNKGAALTSYLSLAGRYCVLMPNSSSGGGISRKISNGGDRKRLKEIVSDLSLPKSMGLIVRTAGLSRTKPEIKRDFDYLARLWDEIRERTLSSSAPSAIHSDSDLIKRAIRDIYNREIEEVIVEGDEGYKAAKAFMKLLMPSHARRVKHYADPVPLFQRYGAEDQLSAMYDPMVQLKSGGYLIINPTEALVSIDINSGRSTKEHGIEQTALHTNLEAAREIARQLRLRDMAGLVVIDFIDMENNSNVRKVERAMKDALKNDRARIQVGRISSFGLMEMSRQRLRTGVLEATTRECPHCDGTGLVRTASSAGLSALRLIEDEAAKGKGTQITLYASTEAAVYLLNTKRSDLAEIEERYGVYVEVQPEGEDEGAKMRVGSAGPKPSHAPKFEPLVDDDDDDSEDDVQDEDEDDDTDTDSDAGSDSGSSRQNSRSNDDDDGKPRRRRRRGGRGRNRNRSQDDDDNNSDNEQADSDSDSDSSDAPNTPDNSDRSEDDGEDKPRRRRRRGGRGRSRRRDGDEAGGDAGETASENAGEVAGQAASNDEQPADTTQESPADEAPAPAAKPKRTRRKKAEVVADEAAPQAEAAPEAVALEKPKRTRRKKADPVEAPAGEAEAAPAKEKPKRAPRKKAEPKAKAASDKAATTAATSPQAPAEQTTPPAGDANGEAEGEQRRGWWQRTFGS